MKTDRLDVSEALARAIKDHQAGRLREAQRVYQDILQVQPGNAEALHLLGVVHHQSGNHDRAVDLIGRAIHANPKHGLAHYNLGLALKAQDKLDRAIASFRLAVTLEPKLVRAHHNLGLALADRGEPAEATAAFRRALALDPKHARAHYHLGNALKKQGMLDEAVAAYRAAAALRPDHAETHYNLGNTLKEQGRLEDAIAAYRRAVAVDPDYALAHNNLGIALFERGDLDEAVAAYERALAIEPDYPEAHANLGMALVDLGKLDAALAAYRRSLALNPKSAASHLNYALALLLRGDLGEGWAEYEWRWGTKEGRDFPQPRWQGDDLSGRTILLWNEQSIGDQLLFAGLLPDLFARGAHCVMECDPRFVPLFSRSFPQAEFVAQADPPHERTRAPEIAYQAPMGNLCRWLRPDLESFPERGAYVTPDREQAERLRERYRAWSGGRPVIGVSWRCGHPKTGGRRSAGLGLWGPVLKHPGAAFVNLQYGDRRAELAAAGEQLGVEIRHDPEVDPLTDLDLFAAQVAAMDLVISVNNSTVHMAGALGKPVWTVLPFAADWRWTLSGPRTPWYPTMRLFRQPAIDDWETVLAEVGDALAARLAEGSRA